MKYFKVQIEFTVPMALETPMRGEIDSLVSRIKAKQELSYARNINIRLAEETIDSPIKKGYSSGS
jgi:hypothetical protein